MCLRLLWVSMTHLCLDVKCAQDLDWHAIVMLPQVSLESSAVEILLTASSSGTWIASLVPFVLETLRNVLVYQESVVTGYREERLLDVLWSLAQTTSSVPKSSTDQSHDGRSMDHQQQALLTLVNLTSHASPALVQMSSSRGSSLVSILMSYMTRVGQSTDTVQIESLCAIADCISNLARYVPYSLFFIAEIESWKPARYERSGVVYLMDRLVDVTGKDQKMLHQAIESMVHNLTWTDMEMKKQIQRVGISHWILSRDLVHYS